MDLDKIAYIAWCIIFLILCFIIAKNLKVPEIVLDITIMVAFLLIISLVYFHLIFFTFLAISIFALLYVLRIKS